MEHTPLSETALRLLALIHEQTRRDGTLVTHYWVPGIRWQGVMSAIEEAIIIGGLDASLQRLESRGLIWQSPTMRRVHPRAYASTEQGAWYLALLLEERCIRNAGRSPAGTLDDAAIQCAINAAPRRVPLEKDAQR